MMRPASVASIAAILAAAAIGSACGAPVRDAGTVTYASGSDLESANPLVTIHPLSRQVQRHALFVTLARYDDALAPSPYAAREWSWSADRRRLRMVIAPGLRWSDGRKTTAADAAWTIDAARDPATGYPRAADLATIARVTAPDDTTLVIEFGEPPPAFPLVLCELPILPAHVLRDVAPRDMRRAAFATAPVTNGPFRFGRREAGQRWILERNDAFPAALGGPPEVRRLVIAVVDEPTTKFAGLVSGELDVAGISPSMASLAARDPSLAVLDYPVLFSYALVFNAARAPLDDPRLRRAMSRAIDRPRIVEAALAGYATPAAGPVPPNHPFAGGISRADRDTALADSLLDAAGWRRGPGGWRARNGARLTLTLSTVGSGANVAEQLLQADLASRGIEVEIRVMELGAFLSMARAPEKAFDMLLTGIPGDLSLAHVSAMYHSGQMGGALDYGGFHRPELDRLLESARSAPDAAAARSRWSEVSQYLDAEMPAAWIYHARGLQGISRRLSGVRMDLRGELATLAQWRVSSRAPHAPRALTSSNAAAAR